MTITAIQTEVEQADKHHMIGLEYLRSGDYQDAMDVFNQDVTDHPFNPVYLNNRGTCYRYLGRDDLARKDYLKAIDYASRYTDAIYNLGALELSSMNVKEAKKRFKRCLEIDMEHKGAMSQMLNILSKQAEAGDHKGAIAEFKELLAFQPFNHAVWDAYGVVLQLAGQLVLARKAYNASLELNSENPSPQLLHNISDVCFNMGDQDLALQFNKKFLASVKDEITPGVIQTHSGYLFKAMTLISSFEKVYKLFKEWASLYADHLYPEEPPQLSWDGQRKIRVGFVGRDFNGHSAQLSFGVLLSHYNRDLFQVIVYNDNPIKDPVSVKMESQVDCWRDTHRLSDEDIAGVIRADNIDVLIDLQGHTANTRLLVFARKPAPIQITGLGFGHSTGMKAMDYIFTDPVLMPSQFRNLLPEKPIDLKTFIHLPKPPYELERVQPFKKNGFITFGNFGSVFKITPIVINTWANILGSVDDSELILKTGAYKDRELADYVLEKFRAQGVENKIHIIGQTSHLEHLKAHNKCDIMLDTFPYSSGVTASEALFMGKPLVSYNGQGTRASESILASTLGSIYHESPPRDSLAAYEDLALELAHGISSGEDHLYLAEDFCKSPVTDSLAYLNDIYDKIFKLVKGEIK